METTQIIIITVYGILSLLIGISIGKSLKKKKVKKKNHDLPNCRCADVTQCDTWCIAKENFLKYHG